MKKINKFFTKITAGTLFLFMAVGCSSGNEDFTVTNNSEIDRVDEPIVLSRDDISGKYSIPENQLPVAYLNGEAIASQADDLDQDGEWDELAFTIDIPADEEVTVAIRFVDENNYPDFTQRTNVRFGVKDDSGVNAVEELTLTADELPVPLFERFQMDGPAWENDKIGFRQYIDGRNGRDLYGKTSPEMALDTVGISDEGGLEDNYHVMLPWGRDILAVGNSLGLGGLAMLHNGEVQRLGVRMDADQNNVDTTKYQLITEGPVRSIFRLTYTGWKVGEEKVDLTNNVTIWAGQYSHINEVTINKTENADTLVVGVVNIHNDNEPVLLEKSDNGEFSAFFTHDQQTYDKGWYLGMGLIFPSEYYVDYQQAPDSGPGVTNSFNLLFDLDEGETLEYYVFGGWELSDENFTDEAYFREFIETEWQKLSSPVSIQ